MIDVDAKIEKIDPPTKKVGKTVEVLPEDENIKKLYSLLEAILEKRMWHKKCQNWGLNFYIFFG